MWRESRGFSLVASQLNIQDRHIVGDRPEVVQDICNRTRLESLFEWYTFSWLEILRLRCSKLHIVSESYLWPPQPFV